MAESSQNVEIKDAFFYESLKNNFLERFSSKYYS